MTFSFNGPSIVSHELVPKDYVYDGPTGGIVFESDGVRVYVGNVFHHESRAGTDCSNLSIDPKEPPSSSSVDNICFLAVSTVELYSRVCRRKSPPVQRCGPSTGATKVYNSQPFDIGRY